MKEGREIKFDYMVKLRGEITHNYVTLEQVEQGVTNDDDYEIVARREYTGLKDKNGVEIYEGDLLKVRQIQRPLEVVWEESGAYFRAKRLGSYTGYAFNILEASEYEVIGNIYENPELLEASV